MASQTPKSTHKRFADSDSDSPQTFHDSNAELVPTPPKHKEDTQTNKFTVADGDVNPDSDSDSDAPPEAVSASTALEASRSAAKRTAETRRHATEAERAKRQRFDAARVKETKSRRTREAQEKETEAEASTAGGATAAESLADTTLPTLDIPDELPAEVIAAAEQERTAKSRQRAEKLATREAERLLKEERQLARKLKLKQYLRGPKTKTSMRQPGSSNTVVRVLPKMSDALPPRSTRREQIAREHFLKGPGAGGMRRGRGGRVDKGDSLVGRRKPWKSSFVVK